MKYRWLLLAVGLGVLLLAACGGSSGPENVYIADEADDGETVAMAVGDVLQISLPENRTTGFVWNVVVNDETILRPTDQPAYVSEDDSTGAGGRVTFVFQAVGAGTITLELINAQPGATAASPVETYALAVTVSP